MSAIEIFRGLWSQRHDWSAGTGACPDGIPVPRRDRCEECDSELLTELARGDVATVSCLDADGSAMAKLASLGVLPGVRIRMVQRYPAYVFRLGWAEVAIDEGLASLVRVRRNGRTTRPA